MNMKIFSLTLLICLFLFGCDDGNDTIETENPNKPETNVQIYNKNDGFLFFGNGVVNATIYPWNRENIWTVQAGSITNGKLNFSFPSTIPDEKLEPFLGEYEYPNVSITPTNTKFCGTISTFRFPFIVYNSFGEKLGELKYGKITMNGNNYIADTVYYWYFNKDVNISGFFTFPVAQSIPPGLMMSQTENYQINAKRGWNRIYLHETKVNNDILSVYSTELKNIPKDLKWEFE